MNEGTRSTPSSPVSPLLAQDRREFLPLGYSVVSLGPSLRFGEWPSPLLFSLSFLEFPCPGLGAAASPSSTALGRKQGRVGGWGILLWCLVTPGQLKRLTQAQGCQATLGIWRVPWNQAEQWAAAKCTKIAQPFKSNQVTTQSGKRKEKRKKKVVLTFFFIFNWADPLSLLSCLISTRKENEGWQVK